MLSEIGFSYTPGLGHNGFKSLYVSFLVLMIPDAQYIFQYYIIGLFQRSILGHCGVYYR